MKIKGKCVYVDASGVTHEVKGANNSLDDKPLQMLNVSGKLLFDKISCDEVNVAGKCEGNSLSAKNVSVEGKMEADSLSVEQLFKLAGKLKINSVTADEIVIDSRSGSIGNVECRRLKIFNNTNTTAENIFTKFFGTTFLDSDNVYIGSGDSRFQVKSIDADTVELENCEIEVIRCKEAFIGSNCAIEKLFVVGECKIAENSKIGETIRT